MVTRDTGWAVLSTEFTLRPLHGGVSNLVFYAQSTITVISGQMHGKDHPMRQRPPLFEDADFSMETHPSARTTDLLRPLYSVDRVVLREAGVPLCCTYTQHDKNWNGDSIKHNHISRVPLYSVCVCVGGVGGGGWGRTKIELLWFIVTCSARSSLLSDTERPFLYFTKWAYFPF